MSKKKYKKIILIHIFLLILINLFLSIVPEYSNKDYDTIFSKDPEIDNVTKQIPISANVRNHSLFKGMYIRHYWWVSAIDVYISRYNFTDEGNGIFNNTWSLTVGDFPSESSWDVNTSNRKITNITGPCPHADNSSTPSWIFNNTKLGDHINITVTDDGDHTFNVTSETIHNFPTLGNVDVWILEDLDSPGYYAWYEKSTGILLNGSFNGGGSTWYYDFLSTNVNVESNTEPLLSTVIVYPLTADDTDEITFKVLYTDDNNDSASYVNLVINGTIYSMEKENQSDNNYIDGCKFLTKIKLSAAQYNYFYYFECSDGSLYYSTSMFNDLNVRASTSKKTDDDDDDTIDPPSLEVIILLIGIITIGIIVLVVFILKRRNGRL